MSIRNAQYYMEGVWDWGILRGCFGNTKIEPTDIDGCVERKGRFLYLETKRPGVQIPFGQELTFKSFISDGHTVLIIWGENNQPESMRLMTPFKTVDYPNADLETLKTVVSQWFQWADGNAVDASDPASTARAFWRRKGRAYCDTMMAEWTRLDEREKARA